jgi:general secretion pathway protein C
MAFWSKWFKSKPSTNLGGTAKRSKIRRVGAALRKKLPKTIDTASLDLRNVNLDSVQTHSRRFQWALIVLAVFLASALASRVISLFIRPTYTPIPTKRSAMVKPPPPAEDYSLIEQRNIFDVENKIPENFDPGFLDCLSQAKLTTARLRLHGTIVMHDESLSVALVEEDGNPNKIGVRKDETFFEKYLAMKVDRKKFCFQVKATQELEYIEIPEEGLALGVSGPSFSGKAVEGIVPVNENNFVVKSNFLEGQLNDLNTILQTAKAVPYMDAGKMKGFLIQSIDPDSLFASLGIRQGDILSGVNDIQLDNIGQGVTAFQRLRKASRIELRVIRGGQEVPLTYEVK